MFLQGLCSISLGIPWPDGEGIKKDVIEINYINVLAFVQYVDSFSLKNCSCWLNFLSARKGSVSMKVIGEMQEIFYLNKQHPCAPQN